MPESPPRTYDQEELDRLLNEMHALIPDVVRQACHKLGYHPGQAERDGIEQDLLVTLIDHDYHTLRCFQGDAEPSTWLFTIAERQIKQRLKKERKKVDIDNLPPESLTTAANQEEELLWKEEEALAAQAINQLNPEEQTVVRMMADGRTIKEIAQALGKSEGAAKMQRSRVRAKLKESLISPRDKGWSK